MLIRYKEENGKLPPLKEKELGRWMMNQRYALKKLKKTGGTNNKLDKFEEHSMMGK